MRAGRFALRVFARWIAALRDQIGGVAATYGLLMCVYLAAKAGPGERWTIIALLNNGAHWLLLPSLIALPATWTSRHRRFWALYCLPGVVAFLVWYGPLFLPGRGGSPADTVIPDGVLRLTVATFNAARSGSLTGEYVALLRAMKADIAGLQESGWRGLDKLIEDMYPYAASQGASLILSRYPIVADSLSLIFSVEENTVIRAQIDVDGRTISVYSAHLKRPEISLRPLAWDAEARHAGAVALASALADDPYPALVLCDCNTSDQTEDYTLLAALVKDTWREIGAGFGLTAPHGEGSAPLLLRSDYIWHSGQFTPRWIAVWPESPSDHLPVLAGFDLP